MSVTITITDPSSTPPEELQAVLSLLRRYTSDGNDIRNDGNDIRNDGNDIRNDGNDIRINVSAGDLSMVAPEEKAAVVEGASRVWYEETAPINPEAFAAFGVPVPPPLPSPTPISNLLAPAPSAATGVELDKDGIPWDGRIHVSTKTKTVEGVWKKKRGVEQAVVDTVTAELRAVMAAPALPTHEMAVTVPPPPAPAAEAPVVTVPPPPAPVPPAATGITFAEFMGHVTAGVTSQRFTREGVTAACVANGIPNLPGLINRPDLIPAVARELGLMA